MTARAIIVGGRIAHPGFDRRTHAPLCPSVAGQAWLGVKHVAKACSLPNDNGHRRCGIVAWPTVPDVSASWACVSFRPGRPRSRLCLYVMSGSRNGAMCCIATVLRPAAHLRRCVPQRISALTEGEPGLQGRAKMWAKHCGTSAPSGRVSVPRWPKGDRKQEMHEGEVSRFGVGLRRRRASFSPWLETPEAA